MNYSPPYDDMACACLKRFDALWMTFIMRKLTKNKPAQFAQAPELANMPAESLEHELLSLLERQSKRVPAPVFLSAALLVWIAHEHISTALLFAWLFLVLTMLIIRRLILLRLPHLSGIEISKRVRIAIVLSAANGCVHGLSLFFFPYLPEFDRAIQSMIMVGLSAGAVATTAGYLPLFIAYIAPTLLPLALMWAIYPNQQVNEVTIFISLLIAMFAAILIAMAQDAYRMFKESFEIRLQHVDLNRQLQSALNQAQIANQSKTRFLASASHDLRQPIHTLALFGAALIQRPLDGKTLDIANHLNKAVQTLALQLDALLDISKLDAGVVDKNIEVIQLRSFLDRLRDEFSIQFTEKGLRLNTHCPQNLTINSDKTLLLRILRNLLSNAVKFTEVGGVEIAAAVKDQQFCELTVTDTGKGINKEELPRIFEEFYQVGNTERDRNNGLGLGLAIVERLTRLLDIELRVSSIPNEGTKFTLHIPLAGSLFRQGESTPYASSTLHGIRALVVDDEHDICLGMQTLLEGMGCEVRIADGTQQAETIAKSFSPDILLADLRLRGADNGLATIAAIKKLLPDIAVLLISGDTSPQRLVEVNRAGVKMLHKPVVAERLKMEIHNALAQQNPQTQGEDIT